jgi:hypothetical protein
VSQLGIDELPERSLRLPFHASTDPDGSEWLSGLIAQDHQGLGRQMRGIEDIGLAIRAQLGCDRLRHDLLEFNVVQELAAEPNLECRFRRNPDRYSDLKPDSIPE